MPEFLKFENISREYAGRWVLQNISFEMRPGQKIGLIGANGSGKTTILRILCGLEQPTQGNVSLSSSVRIGYVPQHVEFDTDETVLDSVLREHREYKIALRNQENAVAQADDQAMNRALHKYQRARDAYDLLGGDHFEQRAHAMLDALGLADKQQQKINQLSGGEKNVLAMTQALLAEPNLLILDEPGNHLDYMGLAWLEKFLLRFRGAVLIVSHNRYLLDRVVGGILELEDGKVSYYSGNYSQYKELRRQQFQTAQAQYKAYQQRLAHLEALVQKFADIAQGHAADASWGKRLGARRSQLERQRAQDIEKPSIDPQTIKPDFRTEVTRADIALQIRGYSKAFGDLKLFDNIDWDITGGQSWALVGPNGCGKTSLLRDIIQHGHWEHAVIRIGPSLTVGYCAQDQEILEGDNTVFDELISIKGTTKHEILSLLARFLFRDDEVNKKIAYLSGGERNRLQLARLMLLKPNFLILDEPTNHLDITTREAVEEALRKFKGTILVVSHDRYFLDKVVNHVAQVSNKRLRLYEGNFSTFWQSCAQDIDSITGRIAHRDKARQNADASASKAGGTAWRERKNRAAAERKTRKTVSQIEQQIAAAEEQKQQLEQQIADAFTTGDHDRGYQLSQKLTQIMTALEELYNRWMEAHENLK